MFSYLPISSKPPEIRKNNKVILMFLLPADKCCENDGHGQPNDLTLHISLTRAFSPSQRSSEVSSESNDFSRICSWTSRTFIKKDLSFSVSNATAEVTAMTNVLVLGIVDRCPIYLHGVGDGRRSISLVLLLSDLLDVEMF